MATWLVSSARADETQTVMVQWTAQLKAAAADLQRSAFTSARDTTNAVLRDMLDQVASGDGAAALLALPIVLRAIAESGLDRADDALWDWQTAVALNPEVQHLPLADYGEAGLGLARRASAEALAPGAARPDAEHVQEPIDPDGVPRRPRVERDPGNAALLVAGLEPYLMALSAAAPDESGAYSSRSATIGSMRAARRAGR